MQKIMKGLLMRGVQYIQLIRNVYTACTYYIGKMNDSPFFAIIRRIFLFLYNHLTIYHHRFSWMAFIFIKFSFISTRLYIYSFEIVIQ